MCLYLDLFLLLTLCSYSPVRLWQHGRHGNLGCVTFTDLKNATTLIELPSSQQTITTFDGKGGLLPMKTAGALCG